MRILLSLCCLLWFTQMARSQALYFPPVAGNAWDTLSAASLGWCTNYTDTLYDYLESRNSKAFILLKDGKIVFEKYFGSFTVDSVWYWASAGKSLTAFVTGVAQQESLLNINDTTSDHIGNGWTIAPLQTERAITIRHQLSMTTGLDDGVLDNHCTYDTCLQYLTDTGSRWAYHNGPYTLLDSVIASATGTTLNNYLQQKIKTPSGMTGQYIKVGFDNVFFSKPRSMARFGLLMLNKGVWNATPILSDTSYFQQMIQTSQSLNLSYGYLWWLNGKASYMVPGLQAVIPGSLSPNAPADMYAALGKNGQMLNIVPSQQLIWLRMGDNPNAGSVPFLMNDTIWQKLNMIICNANGIAHQAGLQPIATLYPNPASNVLYADGGTEPFELQLTDLFGRILISEKNIRGKFACHVATLPCGVYPVSLTTPFARKIVKVLIER